MMSNLEGKMYLAYEYLPGQYDQRADSAEQCLMLFKTTKNGVRIHSGTLLILENATPVQKEQIASYLINPVESRIKDLSILVDDQNVDVADVKEVEGFLDMSKDELKSDA